MTIQANQGFGVSVFGAVSGGGGGTPGGLNTQVQFNSSGSFGASAALTFVSPALTIGTQQTTRGQIVFANTAAGAFATTVQSSNSASAAWTLTLPATAGTANYALTTNGSGVSSWSQISLTAGVTGALPLANGGTGTSTTFTTGSVVFAGASGVYSQNNSQLFWDNTNSRLAVGFASPLASLDIVGSNWTRGGASAGGVLILSSDASSGANGSTIESSFLSGGYGPLIVKTNGAESLRIDKSGNILLGTSSVGTSAVKVIGIANGTAPTTSPAGMGQLYVESGALKYRGSSGTVTTLGAA